MRRRDFIKVVAGSVATWPFATRAQQLSVPVVGILASVSAGPYAPFLDAIKKGLGEVGYREGQNVAFEYRWAEGQYEQLPRLAAELVHRGVTVIVLLGGGPTVHAAKAATSTIPIVFVTGEDPVKSGFVAALNRPAGNVTGISLLSVTTEAKRLQLLHELVPRAVEIGALVNPNSPQATEQLDNLRSGADALGIHVRALNARSAEEIDAVFAAIGSNPVDALTVCGDAFFNTRSKQLVALSAEHKIPTMYVYRTFSVIGGLASYGPSLADAYRQAGIYAGGILRGEKAADLPVQEVVRVEFVLNLKTAKMLGLNIPLPLVGRADEVIE